MSKVMMDPNASLKSGWWSFALPGYRDHPTPTTYSLFAYDDLPPIQTPNDGAFQWLRSQPAHHAWSLAATTFPDGGKPNLRGLPDLITEAQVSLPSAFITFVESVSLHRRIRSCTGCLLELSDSVVPTSKPLHGVLVHFLSDQQSCLHWYLYVDRSGADLVMVTDQIYGVDSDSTERRRHELDLLREEIWLCAPSFVDFVYRFWLENEIWFDVLRDKKPPTAVQKAYLDHYRRPKAGQPSG